jgi:hypothetical protein
MTLLAKELNINTDLLLKQETPQEVLQEESKSE